MSLFDPTAAILRLEQRLAAGELIGNALRGMFYAEKFGIMELYHALAHVRKVPKAEAMRIVIHETESWAGRKGP